jgi:hypothetical protein
VCIRMICWGNRLDIAVCARRNEQEQNKRKQIGSK